MIESPVLRRPIASALLALAVCAGNVGCRSMSASAPKSAATPRTGSKSATARHDRPTRSISEEPIRLATGESRPAADRAAVDKPKAATPPPVDAEKGSAWSNLLGKFTSPKRIPLPRTDTPDQPAEPDPQSPSFSATDGL